MESTEGSSGDKPPWTQNIDPSISWERRCQRYDEIIFVIVRWVITAANGR